MPLGDVADRENTMPPFTQFALLHRGAEYFRQVCMPRENWKKLEDLAPQLAEFDLRCAGQDYDTAADVLLEIDFDYLLLWGHYRLVIELHQRLEGKLSDPWRRQNCTGNLGTSYFNIGEYRKAIEYHEKALAIVQEIGDRRGEGVWLGSLGLAYYVLGQVDKAIEYYQKALAIAQEIGDRYGEASALTNLGDSFVDQGELDEAVKFYSQAIAIADETGNAQNQNEARYGLALAQLRSGDISAARSTCEAACKLDYPLNNHNVLALLGVIALRQGDRAAAKEAFSSAVTSADALLGHSEKNYGALDAKGLDLCGLALCEGNKNYIPDAIKAYSSARAVNRDAGIVVLRLFDELAKADSAELLAGVRAAAAGE